MLACSAAGVPCLQHRHYSFKLSAYTVLGVRMRLQHVQVELMSMCCTFAQCPVHNQRQCYMYI